MTYNEFITGLHIKYHYQPLHSTTFIKFNTNHNCVMVTVEDLLVLKVDAEKMLKEIKNRNMVKAFELKAQGYLQWEIAEMLGLSLTTIEHYKDRVKKYLK